MERVWRVTKPVVPGTRMERIAGFEPARPAWKAGMLAANIIYA